MGELLCFVCGAALGWYLHNYRAKLTRIRDKVKEEISAD